MLRSKVVKLENELMKSETDLQTAQQKLAQYQKDSTKLQTQLVTLGNKSKLLEQNLEVVQTSLTKSTAYIDQLEQREKQLEAQIKREKLEKYGLALALIYSLIH
ncbi:hypothetical protein [Sporomusa aerivorans]|uniref:hypothetical protein n=1 Tax=Sporomusa aerivorans TaxID=204936 RepID=UPI00352BA1C7